MADLATAPQTGASEASTPAQADTGPAPSSSPSNEGAKSPALSTREAISKAMEAVNARPANETERATAVLREGAGADERLDAERAANAEKGETASEASERAKRGWETRRANAEKPAETKPEPVKAEAPAQPAQPVAPKPEPSKYQPPSRLAPEAKAAWDAAPEPLRAEVVRMHDELTAGLTKYKTEAERFAPLADYEKRSQEVYKQPLADTLKNYVEMDELLASDPLAGLERIVSSMQPWTDEQGKQHPWTLKTLAQYVVEQEGVDNFDNNVNRDLERKLDAAMKKIENLEKGFTQTRETETQQRQKSITAQIEKFASEAPRYAELETHIVKLLKSDLIDRTGDPALDLKAAYELAERLNPAPSLKPPAPDLPAPDPAAQTRRGSASVSGAPSGSNPGRQPVPETNRDAIKKAFATMGIAR